MHSLLWNVIAPLLPSALDVRELYRRCRVRTTSRNGSQDALKSTSRGSKIDPRRLQNRAKIAQEGQGPAQERPRSAQERPRASQERLKSAPRAPQERP